MYQYICIYIWFQNSSYLPNGLIFIKSYTYVIKPPVAY